MGERTARDLNDAKAAAHPPADRPAERAGSCFAVRVAAVSMLSSSALSAAVSAVIWVVISVLTGGGAAFVILGAIACGLVVFVIGYSIRRMVIRR